MNSTEMFLLYILAILIALPVVLNLLTDETPVITHNEFHMVVTCSDAGFTNEGYSPHLLKMVEDQTGIMPTKM